LACPEIKVGADEADSPCAAVVEAAGVDAAGVPDEFFIKKYIQQHIVIIPTLIIAPMNHVGSLKLEEFILN